MKRFTYLCLLLFLCSGTYAQFTPIAEGPAFEEPEEGFVRIVQLKNGNTFYLNLTFNGNISIQLYDNQHKQIVNTKAKAIYSKLNDGNIEGIFEINGNATLLVSEIDDKDPTLYRLVIDGQTGQLKKQEKISASDGLPKRRNAYSLYQNEGVKSFSVHKDPYSDNYAVVTHNKKDDNERFDNEIVHYGADHQEISRAKFTIWDPGQRAFGYDDVVVLGNEEVCLLGAEWDKKVENSEMVLATLAKGKSGFTFDKLSFPKGQKIDNAIIKYNPVTAKLVMLAVLYPDGGKREAASFYLSFADRQTHKVDDVKKIFPEKVNAQSKKIFAKGIPYKGIPQNIFINKDGSVSVLFEESTIDFDRLYNSGRTVSSTILGSIAVMKFDRNGAEINNWLMPKSQYLPGQVINEVFYQNYRETRAPMITWADQYKSFIYVAGGNKDYVLFNDPAENKMGPQAWHFVKFTSIGNVDGCYYTLEGNDIIPQKHLLSDKPSSAKDHFPAMFTASGYELQTNIFVALQLDANTRRKSVRLVWFKAS